MNRKDQTLSTGVLALIAIVIAVGAMLAAALLLSGGHAQATHVTPELITGTGNFTCSDLEGVGQNWTELKVDPNANGTFNDGTLTVTITNTTNDKTFDWSSTIGVDAVFVKAGSATGHNLYRYDPPAEATGDTGLTSPGSGTTNQISHISFCYDLPDPTPTPTPTPTATRTPTATPTPVVAGEERGPRGLPPTGQGGSGEATDGWALALAGAAALVAAAGALALARRRR